MERIYKDPKIGIVTVLYNSGKVVEEFFETLNTQIYTNFVLYVIDNNSPDDSLSKSRTAAQKCSFETIFFAEPQNWGVAKGNNIGINAALNDGCDMVLLSNNDVALEPTTISFLLSGMVSHNATMSIPKIYFYGSNKIWAAGGGFKYLQGHTSHIGTRQEDVGQFDKPYFVKYSPTCFMLIKREVFERVGLMDENYFVYYDDTDFVYRATVKGSESLVYIPTSHLWHNESTCTGGQVSDFTTKYMSRNGVYFVLKNFVFPQRQIVLIYKFFHNYLRKPFILNKHQQAVDRQAVREGRELYKHWKLNNR